MRRVRAAWEGWFAGEVGEERAAPHGAALLAASLLAVSAALFLTALGAPLLEPQEARYAELPRQMLERGDWVVPTLRGEPYLDKPPLLYWLVMGSYSLVGVHDWAARLVPGVAGVCTVLVTFWWGARAVGARAGFLGALVLALWPEFVYRQRMLTFDAVLALGVTAALSAGHVALLGSRLHRGWWALSALACGLALLTKGPVALVLVAGPLLALGFLDRRCARAGLGGWAAYLALAGLVAGPWFVVVALRDPTFLEYFFWRHNVERFSQPFDHARPFWDYLPGLVMGLGPWLVVLGGLPRFLAGRGETRPRALGLFLLAGVGGLVFFSAAGCKRPTYLLPVLPPLALALGCHLARGRLAAGRLAVASLLAGGVLAGLAGWRGMLPGPLGVGLLLGAVVGVGGLVCLRERVTARAGVGVVFGVLLAGVALLLPGYNREFALRDGLAGLTGPEREGRVPVFCFPQHHESVAFYLPRAPVTTFGGDRREELLRRVRESPESVLVVKAGPVLRDLVRDLGGGVEVRLLRPAGAVRVARVRQAGPWGGGGVPGSGVRVSTPPLE